MAYNAKTNWVQNETVMPEDMNRIEQGIKEADTNKLDKTANAVSATKLANKRTIALSGGATGTATQFDGSADITIPVTAINPDTLSKATPVGKGGTGATTAATARQNLDAQQRTESLTIEASLADGDHFPFQDASAGVARKTLWSTIKSTLKTYFDGIYGKALSANITIYVATTGNDTSGDGTSGKPYATVNKALSMLPKNLDGKTAIINIAAGTYSGMTSVKDFTGGTVRFNGVANAGVTLGGLEIENASLLVGDIALTVGSQGIFVGARGMFYSASSPITVTGAATGVTLRYDAVMEITTSLTINGATNVALLVQYNSTASVATLAGSNNNIAVYLYQSIVYVTNLTIAAQILAVNENGGFYQKGAMG